MPELTIRYCPPTKSRRVSGSNSRMRVVSDRSMTCVTRACFCWATASLLGRVDLVHEVVQLLEIAIQPRQHLDLIAEVELDLLGQDEQRPQIGQLRIVGCRARRLVGQVAQRGVVGAAQRDEVRGLRE